MCAYLFLRLKLTTNLCYYYKRVSLCLYVSVFLCLFIDLLFTLFSVLSCLVLPCAFGFAFIDVTFKMFSNPKNSQKTHTYLQKKTRYRQLTDKTNLCWTVVIMWKEVNITENIETHYFIIHNDKEHKIISNSNVLLATLMYSNLFYKSIVAYLIDHRNNII